MVLVARSQELTLALEGGIAGGSEKDIINEAELRALQLREALEKAKKRAAGEYRSGRGVGVAPSSRVRPRTPTEERESP